MHCSKTFRGLVFSTFVLAMVACSGGTDFVELDVSPPDASSETIAGDSASADVAAETRTQEDAAADGPPEQVGEATSPTVTFVQPQDGAAVEGIVAVEIDATDDTGVASVEFLVDGESLGTDEAAPFEFEWDATDLWSGTYALKAIARDAAGNEGEATVNVTVLGLCDEDGDCPPTVGFDAPEAGAYVGGLVEVKASAGDDDAVVKVRFLVDGGLLIEDEQVPYRAEWDTAEFDDGPHLLAATAYDTTDKTAAAQIEVTVDNTPPEIALLSPEDDAIQHDEILLSAEASDTLQMDRVEFSVDDGDPEAVSEEPWELVYDATALVAGTHVIEATAFDAAGNEATVTREFLVDRPPVVVILAPEEGETVPGAVTVQAEVADDVGLAGVALTVDGVWVGDLFAVEGGLFEILWTPPYELGEHLLSVVATDSEGQESEAAVTVAVDHPVTVDFLLCVDEVCEPLEADTELTGTVQVRAVAEDDGAEIVGVDFLVDGAPAYQDLEAPFDFVWDTIGVDDGARVVSAVATNALDETGETQVQVQVNNCDLDHDDFAAVGCGGPDCDDGDAGISPAAQDLVGNDLDENCDGADGVDADGDGYASESSGGDDCDDALPLVHPCGDDLPGDGVDGNCDDADVLSCDDCLPCTVDGFVAGACVHAPISDGDPCDDGDLCTGSGTCQDLACLPGEVLSCDDANPCTADGCVYDSGCYHLPLDGLPCGGGGVCAEGTCCLPDCGGKACGGDGCGGSCGTCGAGLVCDQGACVDPCTPDCGGKECGGDGCGGTCPCGAGFVCAGTACVFDPESGPGSGPGPDCLDLLPPMICEGGQDYCGELVQFDPAEGYGYVDQLMLAETWDNQYRSWMSRHAAMMIEYATAYVACKAADWPLGNGGPLGLLDMSEADGAIPGTSIGQPAHPPGTHTNGYDMDVAYYQAGTPDNLFRPICDHEEEGVDAYHCVAAPHLLDPWRTALFIGALQEHPDLRVIGCDGKAGPAISEALTVLCVGGWLSGAACNNPSLTWEATNQGYGWFLFHHGNMHVSFHPSSSSCAPSCQGKACGDDGCGGSCGVCPFGEACSVLGACEAGCIVSSKITELVPGVGGHPGEAVDVDANPSTCTPAGNCELGLDNAMYSAMGSVPFPLPGMSLDEYLQGALEDGDATILLSASAPMQVGLPFVLGLFDAEFVAPPDCDFQAENCDYSPIEWSPEAQFDNALLDAQGQLTAGGPAYDVMVPCWVAPWACASFIFGVEDLSGGYTQAYNVRLEADVTTDDCGPMTLVEGVIGGAILKQDIIDIVMQIPDDQLPIDKGLIIQMLNMLLIADIDVDGDGDLEGISFGMKIAGIPANLVPVECSLENPIGTCPDGQTCLDGECLTACGAGVDCPGVEYCQYPEGTCGAGEVIGACVPVPPSCPDVWDPVCGCDDQTYASACELTMAGQSMAQEGTCAPCYGPGELLVGEPDGMCCDGLTPVPPCSWDGEGCLCPMCLCWYCTACGNGSCGPGEDQCNCPEDCLLPPPPDCEDPYACQADTDCVKTKEGCCPCHLGGTV